ncbi:MAG: hypothetical protein KBT28_04885 [Bacteroidales bacterium]|nr:hypothetical protein [Candidatus Colimorpha merdihippi]
MKRLLILAFVAMGLAAMTSCKKDYNDLILGKWTNTSESVIHGPSGEDPVSAGRFLLDFTADSVVVMYPQTDTIQSAYRLYQENGVQMLILDDYWLTFEIEDLNRNKMVLKDRFYPNEPDPPLEYPEFYYRWEMKRAK